MQRPSGRAPEQLREINITRNYTRHAEGSVLVCFGDTKVICTASVEKGVPSFMRGEGRGWVTAEYGIQRLIGRSLRAALDLSRLGENTITVDCDVIQADGGTRTAAITGACVALVDAVRFLQREKMLKENPLLQMIASVSVGIYQGVPVLDLDYAEDSSADTDMNVIMGASGGFIEVQGTAEQAPFARAELNSMLDLASEGIQQLITIQNAALAS